MTDLSLIGRMGTGKIVALCAGTVNGSIEVHGLRAYGATVKAAW